MTLLVLLSPCIVCMACGETGKGTRATPARSQETIASVNTSKTSLRGSPSATVYLKDDGDIDHDDPGVSGNGGVNDDRRLFAEYAGRVTEADRRQVTTVVTRYYATAAASDGATACSLVAPSLVAGLVEGGPQASGARSQGNGSACAMTLSSFFGQQHAAIAAENPTTLHVTNVHVKGSLALAVLGFTGAPEAQILLMREGGGWKMDALRDSRLP